MENLGFSADTQNDDQVRVLSLNKGEHQDGNLYKLKKGWVIEFRLGASLLGHNVDVYTNHPLVTSNPFERRTYYRIPWNQESAFLRVLLAGSFHYYVAESSGEEAGKVIASGYLLVDPELTVGKNDEPLPLDCVQCQTVLSKLLGPFSTWEEKLKVSYKSGYNMIHFTPIQVLGESKSAYSLSDQLKLNPTFHDSPDKETTFDDVEKLMKKMREEWNTLSICDIVLNHTANESPFLVNHPECTYNCVNSPHLRPAYLLDAILFELTIQVSTGNWENKGIPTVVETEDHLNAIRHALHTHFLPLAKIHELYIVDIAGLVSEFLNVARNQLPQDDAKDVKGESISIIRDPQYRRLKSTIDMPLALKLYNTYRLDCFDEETRLKKCAEELRNKLQELNDAVVNEIQNHINAAVENTIAGIRYFRVQQDGPRIKEISERNPLVPRYFTDYGSPRSFVEREEIMYSESGCFLMAHNGWVMNGDPLKNFADPDSNVYIRRELIAWGDSVKLRYGEKPEDCPALWQRMTTYVQQMAKIFDGVRLDNCHSTPLPVAEYVLDAARQVKPDLFVIAELFTNSDQKDNIFINRLGITSLIREAMSAWDSHEEGRLVYRYGGEPVGAFIQARHRPLVPSIAHAIFLDQTHDNPSPVEKRSVFDLAPSAALVSMACCASGSNRGYDELVPHHIHVVDEERQYTAWTDDEELAKKDEKYVSSCSGIISAKRALNNLHFWLGKNQFSQVFVDQMDADVVAVTRHSPTTHESVILVAFTAFKHPDSNAPDLRKYVKPLRVEGVVEEIILEASLTHEGVKSGGPPFSYPKEFNKSKEYINGYSEYVVNVKEHIQICDSTKVEKVDSGDPKITQLNFINFQPGSFIAIRVSLHVNTRPALAKVNETIGNLTNANGSELRAIVSRMSYSDLNKALYRCDQEERDESGNKFGVYEIPSYGPLVYAGLQGVISLLADIRPNNDLGHPLCANLRQGNWLIDYTWQRLKEDEGTLALGQWLEEAAEPFKLIPRYLVPSYFDVIVVNVYSILIDQCFNMMSSFIKDGTDFTRLLSLVSVQVGGIVKSAQLPDLSPDLEPPKPKIREVGDKKEQECLTLSAGLPHFAVGYMRNWGRDTFIALRGLLLLTGRFEEARFIILGFAGTLRHGLIPNLLDRGINARFNCRDAVWWWLYTIQCYVKEAPNGIKILSDKVSRLFPTDDSPALPAGEVDQPLHDVIQEALSVHFQGLCFRERNAGKRIDEHMTDRGFNNQIGVNPETGFVFGGNEANCGTWMDKMGSSEKAGNKGKPATPRDGSAVEIVGLCHSTLLFLGELYKQNLFPYGSVQRKNRDGSTITWSYKQWADKMKANFDTYFYVNEKPTEGELKPELIHRRGIYKDTHGASQPWADYQLRPNFPVAMVASPELFEPKHAWSALKKAEEILLGPLGMKTLDPADWGYDGYYNNSNDSSDPKLAHGWNYHQGPEWLWPVGYFLRARLHFAALVGDDEELRRTISSTEAIISRHLIEASTNHWRGLPELTNREGEYCPDSCRTQAWSASTILEVLYDLNNLKQGLKFEEERVHEGSKSVRGSPSRVKAQADINDNDADEDEDDDDDDENDNGEASRQCTETHALLVTSAHASDDLVCPSTTSSPSSSPTPLPKKRRQQPRSSQKYENLSRKSSAEAIQEAAAFLYSDGAGGVKRRKHKPRARQRKVIGELKDFYEKHLEACAKDSTKGIVLTTSEICDICARRADSPVYSDRFVYNQQPLLAREVTLLQTGRGHAVFIPTSKPAGYVDFMPIYKLAKSNASGIFYSTGLSSEVVDLKTSLEPSIVLLDSPRSFHSVESDGPPFYRQFLDKGYSRISEKGTTAQQIAPFKDKEEFRIDMQGKVEERSWMGEAVKNERAEDLERNKSSLLMLEPLLLMSSETASRGVSYKKKRLAHSEHLKLVRIVIAYSLTFVILVSITYYVVYFT